VTSDEEDYDAGYAVITRSIQRDTTISTKAKMVYITLSSRANAQQQCWPAQSLIAKESGMSVDSVQRGLEELRSRGLVSWELDTSKGLPGRHPNRYTLGETSAVPHTAHSGTTHRSRRHDPPPPAAQTMQENDAREDDPPNPPQGETGEVLTAEHVTEDILTTLGVALTEKDRRRITMRIQQAPEEEWADLCRFATDAPPGIIDSPRRYVLWKVNGWLAGQRVTPKRTAPASAAGGAPSGPEAWANKSGRGTWSDEDLP
jgi:hypothetical protein